VLAADRDDRFTDDVMAIGSYRGNDQITGTGDTCRVTSELFNNDQNSCSPRVIPRGERSLLLHRSDE